MSAQSPPVHHEPPPLVSGAGFWSGALLVLAVVCIVHVIRTQRSWLWILLILFMPGLGPLAYLGFEILPGLIRRRSAGLSFPMPERFRIRAAERALRRCDTVDTRSDLAELYARAGRYEEAIALLEPCRDGPLGTHPHLLYSLATAAFAHGDLDEAEAALARIDEGSTTARLRQRRLLQARIHERRGRHEEAEACYREARPGFAGEEAKYRFGRFLLDRGRREEARAVFAEIVEEARLSDLRYRRQERHWIRAARQALRDIDRTPAPAPAG